MRQFIISVLIICGLMFINSCKEPEIIVPNPVQDHDNFIRPSFDTTHRATRVFVNDDTSRVVYVGDEFFVKIVVFKMPTDSLYATAIDSLPLALELSREVVSILDVKSNPGYFAEVSKTDAVCLKNSNSNYVMFAKMLKKGNHPTVNTGSGVIIKIRCKALKATNGYVDLLPSSTQFRFSYWTGGGANVGPMLKLYSHSMQIQNAKIRISDEYIVP